MVQKERPKHLAPILWPVQEYWGQVHATCHRLILDELHSMAMVIGIRMICLSRALRHKRAAQHIQTKTVAAMMRLVNGKVAALMASVQTNGNYR